jgi:hypothetical protein
MVGLRLKKRFTDIRQTNVFGQRDDSLQSIAAPQLSALRPPLLTYVIMQVSCRRIAMLSKRERACLVGPALLHAALQNHSTNCTLATNILVHMLLNTLEYFLILCFIFVDRASLYNLVNRANLVHSLFLVYLSVSTCFWQLYAHHQEKQLCLCDTWYLLFCVDDCLVCLCKNISSLLSLLQRNPFESFYSVDILSELSLPVWFQTKA